jgi:dihydrofolate reductase
MRKLFSFLFASLDGYHEGSDHDIHWHLVDDEFDEFDLAQLNQAGTILLGRVTYDLFADFWPTPAAREADPVRARQLNGLPKVVVSRTLREAQWENTTIIGSDVDTELRKLKDQPGADIGVIGSAKLTAYLIQAGLLDELRVMVNPVLLGGGIPAFPVAGQISMKLLQSRQFGNGNMLLTYEPQAKDTGRPARRPRAQ